MKYIKNTLTLVMLFMLASLISHAQLSKNLPAENYPFNDPSLSIEERVADLIDQLTLEEKAWQMTHNSPRVDRLGIPEYNWWNEALHGVGRSGVATVFPQAIAMGATFDQDLILEVGLSSSLVFDNISPTIL